jgi:hypothetical protein
LPNQIEFAVHSERASLDHYRREWRPSAQLGLAGMWIGAVVSDRSGQQYWGLRGTDDFLSGMTHVVSPIAGFKKLHAAFEMDPTHLFVEYSSVDWFEPVEYEDSGSAVQLSYASGRISRDADGLHWFDASGRWEIHGRNVTEVFTVHVPAQDGVADGVCYRHELLMATGRINDIEVSGYLHQDYAYGPEGLVYTELPIARQLQGMWVSWLHEYADGQLGGGCFWQGRDGLEFGPGYQLINGVTTAHRGITATPAFSADGTLTSLDAVIGSASYRFTFDTSGSPIHFFGRLTGNSQNVLPARSWCWVEYAGAMLTPEILDLMMQRFRLARGR